MKNNLLCTFSKSPCIFLPIQFKEQIVKYWCGIHLCLDDFQWDDFPSLHPPPPSGRPCDLFRYVEREGKSGKKQYSAFNVGTMYRKQFQIERRHTHTHTHTHMHIWWGGRDERVCHNASIPCPHFLQFPFSSPTPPPTFSAVMGPALARPWHTSTRTFKTLGEAGVLYAYFFPKRLRSGRHDPFQNFSRAARPKYLRTSSVKCTSCRHMLPDRQLSMQFNARHALLKRVHCTCIARADAACRACGRRAGHFRYYWIFSIIKNDLIAFFYQINNLFLHQYYLKRPLPIKLNL